MKLILTLHATEFEELRRAPADRQELANARPKGHVIDYVLSQRQLLVSRLSTS